MLEYLYDKASDRKLRLFACVCARQVWDLLEDRSREAVAFAEQYADAPDEYDLARLQRAREDAARASTKAEAAIPQRRESMPGTIFSVHESLDILDASAEHHAACAAEATVTADPAEGAYSAAADARLVVGRADERAAKAAQAASLRELFGNPFRRVALDPACRTATVVSLAEVAYGERLLPSGHLDPTRLAVLADALEDAGCSNADILSHLRGSGTHVRGCWAVDLVRSVD
jgi:hypothetical protein